MKCPKCGYTSFDYLRECKKCGEILDDSRKALNLKMSEPTLFVGLDNKPKNAGKSETDEATEVVDIAPTPSELPTPETDLSSSPLILDTLPELKIFQTSGEQQTEDSSENISSELGSLGSMNTVHSRDKVSLKDTSDIELELPDKIEAEGLELNDLDAPITGLELNDLVLPLEEENKEAEFTLFADNEKPVIENQLENDIPFEFSANDLESDINFEPPSDSPDRDMIELELDMEDEESLDQILADLETNDNSKKR